MNQVEFVKQTPAGMSISLRKDGSRGKIGWKCDWRFRPCGYLWHWSSPILYDDSSISSRCTLCAFAICHSYSSWIYTAKQHLRSFERIRRGSSSFHHCTDKNSTPSATIWRTWCLTRPLLLYLLVHRNDQIQPKKFWLHSRLVLSL